MQISYNWLKELVDIEISADELAEVMTRAGVAVEHVIPTNKGVTGVVVAKVLEKEKHPEADKLNICQVTTDGENKIQVVCGAPNVAAGQTIAFATVGATLPDGVKIKKAKLRGVESNGMICSVKELGVEIDKIPPEQKEGIVVLPEGTPLGTSVTEVLHLDDYILELDLTPNRSDCLSVLNVAMEIGALLGKEVRLPQPEFTCNDENIADLAKVTIEAPELCHRYTAKMVKGVKIQPSPFWLQHRLQCAGIRPINNVVDVTNYVMMEYGQPLHAFDYHELANHEIIVRQAKADEEIVTLDSQKRVLADDMLLICDGAKPVAVAGVMGGENTEVTDDTTDVFIESAYFQPTSVRRTSTRLGLRSEASIRFEKGINFETVLTAAERAAQLIQLTGGGTVVNGTIDNYPTKHERAMITLPMSNVNQLLGTEISNDEIKAILTKLNFVITKEEGDMLTVEVPAYRPDCSIKEDLIEEVARVYGYDTIPQTLPFGASSRGQLTEAQKIRDNVVNKLVGLGLNEVLNYSFINKNNDEKLNYPADDIRRNSVAILNPLSEEQGHMRTSIVPGLLNTVLFNHNRRNEDLAIFEIGKVFLLEGEITPEELANEKWTLGIALKGKSNATWQHTGVEYDFFYLKGIIEELMAELKLTNVEYRPCKDNSIYHPGRSAYLYINGQMAGVFGELHPAIAANYGINGHCYIAEIDVETIIAQGIRVVQVELLPKFPAATRDMAVVVEENVLAGDLERVIAENKGELLKSWKIFDVYQGDQIAKGYKSIAFALTFQADRTLTDEEVSAAYDKVLKALEAQYQAQLRN
ncbi:MAG: phenylalanine--tRNA ligase subunit beta [Peptococcaceae bacterium]|nr:phenylalanine--tRNA ligase subunit beta [Peptococcaceae bacterium]